MVDTVDSRPRTRSRQVLANLTNDPGFTQNRKKKIAPGKLAQTSGRRVIARPRDEPNDVYQNMRLDESHLYSGGFKSISERTN